MYILIGFFSLGIASSSYNTVDTTACVVVGPQTNMVLLLAFFTTRVRSTREGNVLSHVCLSTGGGGCLGWTGGGVPTLDGGTYLGQGVPTLDGGYLPWAYPPPPSQAEWATPLLGWMGLAPPPLQTDQHSEYLLRSGRYVPCEIEICQDNQNPKLTDISVTFLIQELT